MCGIVGFTGSHKPDVLRAMCRRLTHRGPDDEGYAELPGVSLGMRRLAIVDLAGGRQPQANEDGSIVTVFNGELYNHAALRRDLTARGHVFATHHSDTECVVHAFEEYGAAWSERARANGMFGLAIWDANASRLFLYRDRMGKKPLYYAAVPSGIAFASEIKALLLHPDVSRDWDYGALYGYFGQKNVSAPATAYAGVRQLPPGCLLTWTAGEGISAPVPYWRPDFSPAAPMPDEGEAAGRILELLTDAVRLRMDCDVSYGAYLSGGVDSSAVATLMSRFSSRPVKTFCLGYADLDGGQAAGKDQDLAYARDMAARLGTDHHECVISSTQFGRDLPDALAAFDEPFSGTISTFFLSAFMRRHITVAVSGDGADELFASYLAERLSFPMEALFALDPGGTRAWEDFDAAERAALAPFDAPGPFAFLRRVADPDVAVWRDRLSVFSHDERRELLSPEFLDAAGAAVGRNPYGDLARGLTARDALNRNLEIDQRELLPGQVLPFVDRLSMAHSIEVRCPFLDHRLVDYVNALPGRYKIGGGETKRVLRRALAGLLPRELLERPKEGFVQPVYTWMRGPLQRLVLSYMEDLPEKLVRPSAVSRLTARFLAGEPGLEAKVWNLTCFAAWVREGALRP